MKLTKSKLKQLIKEAFETEEDFLEAVPEGEEEGEEEDEEDEGEYEKLRGVYGRKTRHGTPLTPTQAVWATKRGYPFQSEK